MDAIVLQGLRRPTAIVAWAIVLAFGAAAHGADLELLQLPTNSALTVPMGQGLDLIYSAEPLGKSRFRARALNRSHSIMIPELGDGSVYTGNYGFAYGMSNALDLSVSVPFLMDSAGGVNKYGTGDPVLGIKWSRPGKVPADMHTAFQVLLGLPLGYKGEHALDKVGGVRVFSSESLDTGFQFLMDMHFRPVSLYLNGGLFRSGNIAVESQMVYGLGAEFGRRHRWVSVNCEYQARVAFGAEATASNTLKIGARFNLLRGVQLEVNREFGFLDHPVGAITTIGIRTHGYLTGRRRLESRYALYQPPPRVKRVYEPEQVLRLAILNFDGFEEYQAGERLVEKIRTELAPHDSIEVVDLSIYREMPRTGTLSPKESVELARKLGVDVVVTGTVARYDVDRFAGPTVPRLFELPETEIKVALRYRIMWFADASRTDMESLTEDIEGRGVLRKRVRLLPADHRDITVGRSAAEVERVHQAALDDLVGNLLASLAEQFSWVPPEFEYANN
ncbi:hypothetical protein ACFL6X_01725 [Candidatus Latescibacterota bacterium]